MYLMLRVPRGAGDVPRSAEAAAGCPAVRLIHFGLGRGPTKGGLCFEGWKRASSEAALTHGAQQGFVASPSGSNTAGQAPRRHAFYPIRVLNLWHIMSRSLIFPHGAERVRHKLFPARGTGGQEQERRFPKRTWPAGRARLLRASPFHRRMEIGKQLPAVRSEITSWFTTRDS